MRLWRCPQHSGSRSHTPTWKEVSGHPQAPQVAQETLLQTADKSLCSPRATMYESPFSCYCMLTDTATNSLWSFEFLAVHALFVKLTNSFVIIHWKSLPDNKFTNFFMQACKLSVETGFEFLHLIHIILIITSHSNFLYLIYILASISCHSSVSFKEKISC